MTYVPRNIVSKLESTLKTFSTVYLSGARQSGKSTLVRNLLSSDTTNYMSFDTTTLMMAAQKDPVAFIENLPQHKLNVIDEIQRVPEIYLNIKKYVDNSRFEGNRQALFLMTGSADILALPTLAKPMVGRMAILTLHPFSASEVNGTDVNFIDKLFHQNLDIQSYKRADLVDVITQSTFPEIFVEKDIDRSLWFDSYLSTILQRDAVEFAKIRKPELIYQLLVSLSSRVGSLLKDDNIMKEIDMNQLTYGKYKTFCDATFMTIELPSWSKPNKLNKRFVKSKKIYFTDTNFLAFIMRRDIKDVFANDPTVMGHLFENFVASEILKATNILSGKFYVSHFNPVREDGRETDFIVEKDNGDTIAIEVKLSSSLNNSDFKNLDICCNTIGERFKKGVVLYTGEDVVPFGDKLWGVPINYLWE